MYDRSRIEGFTNEDLTARFVRSEISTDGSCKAESYCPIIESRVYFCNFAYARQPETSIHAAIGHKSLRCCLGYQSQHLEADFCTVCFHWAGKCWQCITLSPDLMLPDRMASSKANVIEAARVLPYSSRLLTIPF
jgi:hypothetical protein